MSDSILLIQLENSPTSRTFFHLNSIDAAISEVLALYERRLKQLNPMLPQLSYTLKDIYQFIEKSPEFCILVFDSRLKAFVPHDKQWIKDKVAGRLAKNIH
jgi:Enhancer of rudimentary